jgi:hypothetical protein
MTGAENRQVIVDVRPCVGLGKRVGVAARFLHGPLLPELLRTVTNISSPRVMRCILVQDHTTPTGSGVLVDLSCLWLRILPASQSRTEYKGCRREENKLR